LKNFTAFANLDFWQHLVEFLNKDRNQNLSVHAFDMSKFLLMYFMVFLLTESLGHIMKILYIFPVFNTELRSLGRVVRFNQIKGQFKSPKQQLATSWDAYFALLPDI
jgi:hypothetical protein